MVGDGGGQHSAFECLSGSPGQLADGALLLSSPGEDRTCKVEAMSLPPQMDLLHFQMD